jgi:gamma-glutamyltranspeptidase/glutathione hydrolase
MPEFPFQSRRSPVYATRGMVAASQPLAVAAGLEILSKGGNAADAAVAVAAALNVTEPTSTGLGGDAFALYYDAATRHVSTINGSGRAPTTLSLERLNKEGFKGVLPPYHPYNVTVPGACAMWCDLSARLGRFPLSATLSPAIRLAEEGFPVAPITSYFWQRSASGQLVSALNGSELTIEGRGPNPGEFFRNPGLARTLKTIAEDGKKAFYEGEIAEAIVSILTEAGGCMQPSDLATHQSTWEPPISVDYRGYRIWECPPNGQGLTALLALKLLEKYDLSILPPFSPMRLHLEIEALRIAFADARWFVSDPSFSPIPLEDLLSSSYADERRRGISPQYALPDHIHGFPAPGRDTVYFCVVDGEGNACSFINSNYMGFGTGIVPRDWGFSLQNRGANFSLDPNHPNRLEPGKRPYHTIIPALATRASDNSLFGPFGVMGGFMQPQGHVQVLTRMLDNVLDPQTALDLPRFCIDVEKDNRSISLEEGIPPRTLNALEGMQHPVEMVSGMNRALFGRGQVILRDPDSGVLCGGSDPRADGCAMGI